MKRFPSAHEIRNHVNTGRADGKVVMPGPKPIPEKYPADAISPREPDRTNSPNLRHITQPGLGAITTITDKVVQDHEDARVPPTPIRLPRQTGPAKAGEPMPPIKATAPAVDDSGPDVKEPRKPSVLRNKRGSTGY